MEVTKYELLLVSKIDSADALVSRVEKVLKDIDASDVKLEKLGKKTLAYQIKKQTEANYFVFNFHAQGSTISDLGDMLRLEQEALLRYLITVEKKRKLRKKVKKAEEKVVEKKEESKPKVTVVTKTSAEVKVKSAKKDSKVKVSKVSNVKKGRNKK